MVWNIYMNFVVISVLSLFVFANIRKICETAWAAREGGLIGVAPPSGVRKRASRVVARHAGVAARY
jgi:hypothetical protein